MEKKISLSKRAFNDEPVVKVAKLDENGIPEIPYGWDDWTDRLFELIHANTTSENLEVTFFTLVKRITSLN